MKCYKCKTELIEANKDEMYDTIYICPNCKAMNVNYKVI